MKNKLFIFFLIIICVFLFSADIFAYTQKEQGQFIQQTAKGTGLTRAGYTDIVSAVINVILAIVGAVFISFIVYGGIEWVTSAGSPDKVGHAKKIIKFAIIGIIITAAAYTISNFIVAALEKTTGS